MMKPDSWRDVLAVNLDGVFHGCQAVLPSMISQRSGRVINIASLSALLAPAGQTNYAAAKAGVQAGDLIVGVGSSKVTTVDELKAHVDKADKSVALLIERQGQRVFVPVQIG